MWPRMLNADAQKRFRVLKSAADTLKEMGIKAIRQGGSYASSPSARGDNTYYQWCGCLNVFRFASGHL